MKKKDREGIDAYWNGRRKEDLDRSLQWRSPKALVHNAPHVADNSD